MMPFNGWHFGIQGLFELTWKSDLESDKQLTRKLGFDLRDYGTQGLNKGEAINALRWKKSKIHRLYWLDVRRTSGVWFQGRFEISDANGRQYAIA